MVPGDPMRAVEVRTESVPSYEVPFTDAPTANTDSDLPGLADAQDAIIAARRAPDRIEAGMILRCGTRNRFVSVFGLALGLPLTGRATPLTG
jgi:hypothetical protein